MRKFLRYSTASALTGLTLASAAAKLADKDWDLRKRETQLTLAAGVLMSGLIWTATLA